MQSKPNEIVPSITEYVHGHLKETAFVEQCTAFSGDNWNMPRSVAHISIMFI
jgi:hypothetical protein